MTRARGFTLIEVVGAFFMTIVILVFVTGIFVENGRQREAATALMRERLSTVAALDLVGADLAGAILMARGEEEDPEAQAWRFIGSGSGELGSTFLRFVTQAGPRVNPAEGSSAWIEVVYFLGQDDKGETVLWRWRSPRPPSEFSREAPDSDSPGSMRVAVGVAEFGVRWLDAQGVWQDEWDSTFAPPEQAMPEAAEISIRMKRPVRPGEVTEDPEATEAPGLLQTRRVALVMHPFDVAAILALGQDDQNGPDCVTIDRCLENGDATWYQDLLSSGCGGDDRLCAKLRDSSKTCWSDIQTSYPAIAARAPKGCGS